MWSKAALILARIVALRILPTVIRADKKRLAAAFAIGLIAARLPKKMSNDPEFHEGLSQALGGLGAMFRSLKRMTGEVR